MSAAIFRGAYASRVLAKASRLRGLHATSDPGESSAHAEHAGLSPCEEFSPMQRGRKVRFRGTPKPTRGTRMLPGFRSHILTNDPP